MKKYIEYRLESGKWVEYATYNTTSRRKACKLASNDDNGVQIQRKVRVSG